MTTVPWITSWSDETKHEFRPCRWAGGKLALWFPHQPGTGKPIWKQRHLVRSRKAAALMLCNVCGEPTPREDRWMFVQGGTQKLGKLLLLPETPVHRRCAEVASLRCPFLSKHGDTATPFPERWHMIETYTDRHLEKDYVGRDEAPDSSILVDLKIAIPFYLISEVHG